MHPLLITISILRLDNEHKEVGISEIIADRCCCIDATKQTLQVLKIYYCVYNIEK